MKRAVILGAVAVILFVLWVVPNVLPPRTVTAQNACVANLKYIEDTKRQWAVENRRGLDARPTEADLFGPSWKDRMPSCPAGGTYTIGRVNENPTCSIGPPAHAM